MKVGSDAAEGGTKQHAESDLRSSLVAVRVKGTETHTEADGLGEEELNVRLGEGKHKHAEDPEGGAKGELIAEAAESVSGIEERGAKRALAVVKPDPSADGAAEDDAEVRAADPGNGGGLVADELVLLKIVSVRSEGARFRMHIPVVLLEHAERVGQPESGEKAERRSCHCAPRCRSPIREGDRQRLDDFLPSLLQVLLLRKLLPFLLG